MPQLSDSPNKQQRHVAAVDLGSNSFHLIVACVEADGTVRIIDRIKEMVRLGSGLDSRNYLDEESQQRALDCLSRFSQRLQNIRKKDIRISGTNTLRLAKNSQKFIKLARKVLDHKIDIISGIEEARLVYQGAIYGLSENENNRMVIDIGGGSTEIIIGKNKAPIMLESIGAGSSSMTSRFFPDGIISKSRVKHADIYVRQKIEEIREDYLETGWDQCVGTSGSIKAIAKVLLLSGISDGTITTKNLKTLLDTLLKIELIPDIHLEGLTNDRRPVFIGGVVILYSLFKALKIKSMNVSDGALREGLMLDIVGRIQHHDIRELSVQQMIKRFSVRVRHANNIDVTCQYLINRLQKSHPIKDESLLQILSWAAQLHEIGLVISHRSYHHHSAYLVQNSDMPGFSIQEQQLLSILIRYHRKSVNIEDFETFSKKQLKDIFYVLIVLRLSIIINRSISGSDEIMNYEFNINNKNVKLAFSEKWFDENALTLADLQNEMRYLKQIGYMLSVKEK